MWRISVNNMLFIDSIDYKCFTGKWACKRSFMKVSLHGGMRCLMRARHLRLAAGFFWSLLWSPAAIAAAAGPADRTTKGSSSYNLLSALLSWQPEPTSSFLCTRWPKERETLRPLLKPILYPEYLFLTTHAWQMRLLFGWNHIYLGSGYGVAPNAGQYERNASQGLFGLLSRHKALIGNNWWWSKIFINIRWFWSADN